MAYAIWSELFCHKVISLVFARVHISVYLLADLVNQVTILCHVHSHLGNFFELRLREVSLLV